MFLAKKSNFKVYAMVLVCAMLMQLSSGLFVSATAMPFYDTGSTGSVVDTGNGDSGNIDDEMSMLDSGVVFSLRAPKADVPMPAGFITSVEVGQKLEGSTVVPFDEAKPVARDASFGIKYTYTIPPKDSGEISPNIGYWFEIPDHMKLPSSSEIHFLISEPDVGEIARGTVGNGRVTITFNDTAQTKKLLDPGEDGTFWFGMSFNKDKIENNGDKEFTDWGNGTSSTVKVPFKVDQVTADVEITKNTTGADITNSDRNLIYTIPWVITLKPKMENVKTGDNKFSKWVVTDVIPAHLEYVTGTGAIVDKVGVTVPNATISLSGETLTCTFPDDFVIDNGSVYTLSFRTKFNPAIVADSGIATDGKYTFKNTATTEYTYPQYEKDTIPESPTKGQAIIIIDGDKTGTKDAKAETEITGGSFDKKGVLTAMKPEAKIKWTIDVTNAVNLENPTIKDELPEKATLDLDSIKINGNKIGAATGGNTTANTYKLDGRELTIYLAGGTAAQTITYETTLSGLVAADVNIINNAQFLGGPGPNLGLIFEKSATVPLNDQLMTKGGTYNPADHTIDWTIQVSGAGSSLKNVVLTDKITEGQEFVADSLKAVPAAQSAEYNTDTKTITVIYDGNPSDSGKEKVTYKTKLTDDQKHLWGNNVTSGDDKKAYNDVTLTATDMISLTVTGNAPITSEVLRKEYKGYDFATHKAKWQVTVNQNQMAITNPVVIDEITTAGWAFVQDDITVTQDGTDVTATKLNKKDFADNTTTNEQRVNPKMTLTLANMQQSDKPYVITYYTVLAEDKLQTNTTVPISNTVILTGNEIYTELEPVTKNATVGSNVLNKKSNGISGGYISWEVIINENLVPITASDGAELKLTDALEEGLVLDLSSVVLEKYDYKTTTTDGVIGGTWTEGDILTPKKDYTINYNNKTRVFEIIFPTNKITTAYKLSFRTDVLEVKNYTNTISFSSITGDNPGGSKGEIIISGGGGITGADKRGNIKIIKQDSDNTTLLTGAEFTLSTSKKDDNAAAVAVGENGVLEFENEKAGTYYLTEVKAPYGYLLPIAPANQTEVIVKGKETTGIPITNTRITNDLTITKTDATTDAPLDGAEFTVTRTSDNANDNISFADVTITSGKTTTLKTVAGTGANAGKFVTSVDTSATNTDEKGKAILKGLPVGEYTVTEKTAPSGYVRDAKSTYSFKVENGGATHAHTFKNTQILGSLKLTKTDGKTPATPLAGAEFTVKRVGEIDDNTNNSITFAEVTIKTDTNGIATLANLPVGSYTVTETKAPNGYVLDATPKTFVIEDNGTAIATPKTLTFTNEKIEGTLLVTKTDDQIPAKKLQGAAYTATKTDAPNIGVEQSATTDINGVATFKLAAGTYTVVETKAPSGYVLNATPQTVTIVDNIIAQPAQVTISFTNTQILGSLELTKTDELGRLLEGAEFSVTRAGTPAFTAIITTDVNGKATLASLLVGKYTVTETKAPNGYMLDATPQTFTIDDYGTQQAEPKTLTFENTWAKGKLQISKTDAATGASLAGAEFNIVKIGGGYSEKVTTDANGKAEVTELPRGNYEVGEVKAPKGYQINTTKQTIAVTDIAPVLTLDFTNTLILGSLELTKTDDKTPAKPLEGAKFELYSAEGDTLVGEGTTDKDGKLRFDNLTAGNYYYKEKQAPVGFVKDETKRSFSITVNGQIVAETFTNKAVPPPNNSGGNTPSVSPPPEVVIVPPPTVPQSPLPGTPTGTTPQISTGIIEITPAGTPNIAVPPANGTVTIDKDGKWVYTPKAGFVGEDEFTVTATYPSGYTETFVIKLSVLSGYTPFLPETGEAPRTIFYVGGVVLIMLGVLIKRKLKKI